MRASPSFPDFTSFHPGYKAERGSHALPACGKKERERVSVRKPQVSMDHRVKPGGDEDVVLSAALGFRAAAEQDKRSKSRWLIGS